MVALSLGRLWLFFFPCSVIIYFILGLSPAVSSSYFWRHCNLHNSSKKVLNLAYSCNGIFALCCIVYALAPALGPLLPLLNKKARF